VPLIVGSNGKAPDIGVYFDGVVAAGVAGGASGLQRRLMDDINEADHKALCSRSTPDALRRILGGTGRGAGAWIHAMPVSEHFQLRNDDFYLAVLKRLGLPVVAVPLVGPALRRCAACVEHRRVTVIKGRAARHAGGASSAAPGPNLHAPHSMARAPMAVGAKRGRPPALDDTDTDATEDDGSDSGQSVTAAAVYNSARKTHDPAGWHADLCYFYGKAERAYQQASAFAASLSAKVCGASPNRILGGAAHPTEPSFADVPELGAIPADSNDVSTRFDVAWQHSATRDGWRVCDLIVVSPHSVHTAKYAEGAAVKLAEAKKVRHYKSVVKNFDYIRPNLLIAAMDTYGRFGDEFNDFIQREAARIFENDTDGLRSLWTTFFRQRMSCALQRGNARALRWFRNTAWTPDATAVDDHRRLGYLSRAPPRCRPLRCLRCPRHRRRRLPPPRRRPEPLRRPSPTASLLHPLRLPPSMFACCYFSSLFL